MRKNKIANTPDQTDAYYRREIIISFPNKFEGKNEDPHLLEKLTSSQEISSIFNILMKALRDIMQKNRIYLNAKTIKERRLQHDRAVNPVKAFVEEAISEDSIPEDYTIKADLYAAFRKYIKEHSLPSKSIEAFGKELKKLHWEECKKKIGEERHTCWKGKMLKHEYICATEQQLVTVWT
jgi:putative DNA primase/helicase